MKLIMESWRKYLNEADWSNSKDEDWPASNQPKYARTLKSSRVIVFNPDAVYEPVGDTHGRDSHMAKHHVEFFPDQVTDLLSNTLNLIKSNNQETYVIDGSGNPQAIEKDEIALGDLLNTYDFINDKRLNEKPLHEIEEDIYKNYMTPLIIKYDGMVDDMLSGGEDVSNANYRTKEELELLLQTKPVIKFKAKYDGNVYDYVVNTQNSAMVAFSGNKVSTLYNRLKKGPNKELTLKQSLKDFASGKSTVPTEEYSIFRDYVDEITSAQQQAPAEEQPKQAKQKKGPNIRAMVQGMARGGKSSEEIQIQIKKTIGKDISIGNIEGMLRG